MKVQIVNSTLHIGSLQFLCQNSRGIEELQLIVNGWCLFASVANITDDMETHTRSSGDRLISKTASEMGVGTIKLAEVKSINSSIYLLM